MKSPYALQSSLALLLLSLLAPALPGCRPHDGPERVVVSGTVSYRGEPVKRGVIRFIPAVGTEAPVSVCPIQNGRYNCTFHGGVPVGKHKVDVTAVRGKQRPGAPAPNPNIVGGDEAEMEQFIPEKYNTKTTLEITIPWGSGKITKDFDLAE
jgi:hypothetical protein